VETSFVLRPAAGREAKGYWGFAKLGHVLVKCDFSQLELRIAAKVISSTERRPTTSSRELVEMDSRGRSFSCGNDVSNAQGAEVVLAVHDEIVVECPEAQQEQTTVWLQAAMRDGMAPLIKPVPSRSN